MSRLDVTINESQTFQELTTQLRERGFQVDHYHGTEIIPWEKGPQAEVTHISLDGENSRWEKPTIPQGWATLVADEWHA